MELRAIQPASGQMQKSLCIFIYRMFVYRHHGAKTYAATVLYVWTRGDGVHRVERGSGPGLYYCSCSAYGHLLCA